MRGRALPFVFLLLLSGSAWAQVTWQPASPSQVTAESETWYLAGAAIEWNGDFYYPSGTAEAFNAYGMVAVGSYRGIPLYTDMTRAPYSVVFVPIGGGRLQPYQRLKSAMAAGSVVNSAIPPPQQATGILTLTPEGYVAQAPAPPTFAQSYEPGFPGPPQPISPAVPIVTSTAGTAGTAAATASPTTPAPVATTGRTTRPASRVATAYFDYDGRRWISAGKATQLDADFTRVGSYKGAPVYKRHGDALTLYIPTGNGLLAPFKPKGL